MTNENKVTSALSYSLDGDQLSFSRSIHGNLVMHRNKESYTGIKLRRAFPLEIGTDYIGFFDIDGNEIGILKTLAGLDSSSIKEIEEELEKIYFQPQITSFKHLDEEFGVLRGEIETTRGPRSLEIRGYRTNVRILSNKRAIVIDVDGNRYLIEDWPSLPQRIREILGL
ncbi:MAG: DUF1854 domain-containing protein [Candidatus Latescibacterota bacterium]|nr:DUF1854 domain-containing protein [Candidatus Latescibacterota bacterium]